MSTAYHAKYLANKLTLRNPGNDAKRLGNTLFNASINLNPHQIEAAMFAFKSPVSKGVILADEVGLGKTIEAGLIISQYWSEMKRKILVTAPASLVKQWQAELIDKFNIPSEVMDSKAFRKYEKENYYNPFVQENKVIIASHHFVSNMKDKVKLANFDLVIIDEAHKLRNVHMKNNQIAKNIKEATEKSKKILLTATPLQNSLIELYGLSMLIDENIFGDKKYFQHRYMQASQIYMDELRERLSYFVHRTLRKQVTQYINYSERKAQTFSFSPSKDEQLLYELITDYIQDEETYGINKRQRHLVEMVLRKILSSSTYALIGTLEGFKQRLQLMYETADQDQLNDWLEQLREQDDFDEDEFIKMEDQEQDESIDPEKLLAEIKLIDEFIEIAKRITVDSKAMKLLESLNYAFEQLEKTEGANRKVLIFTESRKTQDYLYSFLKENGYDKIVRFSGQNNTKEAIEIYNNWIQNPKNADFKRNTRQTNMRQALLDYFKEEAEIMIATEAGAEGLNMQFCSVLINYDLPWNPQRIEQRIGRCHRYGQKCDVVVINFLNNKNLIDQRVYDLLTAKFHLFEGVFGSSDEVLGNLENGTDIEKELMKIYTSCRTPMEIERAFNELQEKFKDDIDSKIKETRQALIDNFDEDVHAKFANTVEETQQQLQDIEQDFWQLTQYQLKNVAIFNDDYTFTINEDVISDAKGRYSLISKQETEKIDYRTYRMNSDLGEYVIDTALQAMENEDYVTFDITNYPYNITALKNLVGQTGYLSLNKLSIQSYEVEEYLFINGLLDNGQTIDTELGEKLFRLDGQIIKKHSVPSEMKTRLGADAEIYGNTITNEVIERNNQFYREETKRITKWADELVESLNLEISSLRKQIKDKQRQFDNAKTTVEMEELDAEISKIKRELKRKRDELGDKEDEIDEQRRKMMSDLRKSSYKGANLENLFMIKFKII